jgi:hypothetical protein
MASGPRLPNGVMIPALDNTEIYPLMMEMLGLPLPPGFDVQSNSLLTLLDQDE